MFSASSYFVIVFILRILKIKPDIIANLSKELLFIQLALHEFFFFFTCVEVLSSRIWVSQVQPEIGPYWAEVVVVASSVGESVGWEN